MLLGPVLAAASELNATNERQKIGQLYFRAHKYLAVTVVPLTIFAVLNARQLVSLWVGPGLAVIALPFAVLVVANLSSQVVGPAYWVLAGRGILWPGVHNAAIASVLNIVLSFIFIVRWGFSGAVFGAAVPMVIGSVYFLFVSRKYFGKPFHELLRQAYLKPLLCSLCAAVATAPTGLLGLRAWRSLLASVMIFGVFYLAGLVLTRFFDAFDLEKAEGQLPFIRLARRIIFVT